MEDAPEVATPVGPAEQQVVDTFDPTKHENGCFKWVSFQNLAPDGEHVLGEVFFFVCPICGAMLPTPDPDHPEMPFDEWHVQWHLRVARIEDRLADG